MSDLIDRQAAIDAVSRGCKELRGIFADCEKNLNELPSAEPKFDEWCTDCKEYDQERHNCPRWNRVIRQTLKDVESKIVRCKDCKHCDIYKNGYNTFCKLGNLMDDIYGFCSDAERRTDEVHSNI